MRISGWPQLWALLVALYLAPVTYVMQAALPRLAVDGTTGAVAVFDASVGRSNAVQAAARQADQASRWRRWLVVAVVPPLTFYALGVGTRRAVRRVRGRGPLPRE